MDKKSKWFRICTAGDTADGRVIAESDIQQAADSYNPAVYGARINMEHIRGYTPDSPFRMYGDVLALKAERVNFSALKTESSDGKLCLFAQIAPTDDLVAMVNVDKQKVFTSCELQPNFAQSGGTYLVGLAVTDSPASLGTEMLQFCAGMGDKNPLGARKLHQGNLFTVAQETKIEFEDEAASNTVLASAISAFNAMVEKFSKSTEKPAPAPASDLAALPAEFTTLLSGVAAALKALPAMATKEDLAALKKDLQSLTTKLENTPESGYSARPPATGGNGEYQQVDC